MQFYPARRSIHCNIQAWVVISSGGRARKLSNYLTLSNQTGYSLTGIRLMSIDGTFIKALSNHQMNKISTALLPPGNYILDIDCAGKKVYKKFKVVR